MKRLVACIISLLMFSGCGSPDQTVLIAVEQGWEGTAAEEKIKTYCEGNAQTEVVSADKLGDRRYYAAIGAVQQSDALNYGLIKSKPIKRLSLCVVGYDEYRHSEELSGLDAGIFGSFDYTSFINLPEDCSAESYDDMVVLLSDLKEGAIDCAICMPDDAERLAASDERFKVCDLMDSKMYELLAVSGDAELIEYLNLEE